MVEGTEVATIARAGTLTEPFFWRASDLGCLLVHGLTGTPYEMRFLGERLHAAGYTVSGVCLAGHATQVEDLERCRWRDWYASVEWGLEELGGHCTVIAGIGLSLGSLLTLRLAHAHRERIRAVVLLATALQLAKPWRARIAELAKRLYPFLPESWRFVTKDGSDIADQEARRVHPGYRRVPLRCVAELVALQREVRPLLPAIVQPALAMHGQLDHTAPAANLALLQQGLMNLRAAVALPASCHVITVDVEKERVAAEVLRFLGTVIGVPHDRGRRRE